MKRLILKINLKILFSISAVEFNKYTTAQNKCKEIHSIISLHEHLAYDENDFLSFIWLGCYLKDNINEISIYDNKSKIYYHRYLKIQEKIRELQDLL